MRIHWLVLSLTAICSFASYAAKITSLKIEGNTVVFSQSGTKAATSPACAASQPTTWGLQLLTDSDRATYAALVAAAGSNMEIVVTSAQKCVEGTAFEQVKSVEVLPVVALPGLQGLKIVAVGYRGKYGPGIYTTLTAANGKPFMTKSGTDEYGEVLCREGSVPFESVGSNIYVLCLLK